MEMFTITYSVNYSDIGYHQGKEMPCEINVFVLPLSFAITIIIDNLLHKVMYW